VNGYLADIFLKRGITYTFIVEGGNDKSTTDFYNPLYISDDPFGGYSKLSNDEREQVRIAAGADPSQTAGRLCLWSQDNASDDADHYSSFIEYRRTLRLKCTENDKPAVFQFTPGQKTPDTLYYQSYTTYNMGWKVHIVDELPEDIPDWKEEPYQYEIWLEHQSLMEAPRTASATAVTLSLFLHTFLCIFVFVRAIN